MSAPAYALGLASTGVPVFPCGSHKRPTKPADKDRPNTGGFHEASTDLKAVNQLWRDHYGPLIGVPTGAASGFDVLDIDAQHDGLAWWEAHKARIPATRIHRTRSGGLHVFFQAYAKFRNSQSIIGPGVDTRGAGGYIIWWPSEGCEIISAAPIVPWPVWLLDAYLKKSAPPTAAKRTIRPRSASSSMSVESARRMVDRIISRVRHAAAGQRHYRLRAAACTVGGLLDLAQISESDAAAQLVNAAIDAGAEDHRNAEKTAIWGLKKGALSPIELRGRR